MKIINRMLVTFVFAFSLSTSYAGITEDLASNLPTNQVIQNAVDGGMPLNDAMLAIIAANPELAPQVVSVVLEMDSSNPTAVVASAIAAITGSDDASNIIREDIAGAGLVATSSTDNNGNTVVSQAMVDTVMSSIPGYTTESLNILLSINNISTDPSSFTAAGGPETPVPTIQRQSIPVIPVIQSSGGGVQASTS